jgi:hypothetical protein
MACFAVYQRAKINTMISKNHQQIQETKGPVKVVRVMTNKGKRGELIIN